jgi:hypothetical protein
MEILIDMSTVDWKLLRRQKRQLVDSILHPDTKEGLLSLLDYIQDEAAKVLGDKVVFGK